MEDSSMGLRRRYDRPARRAALLALAVALALLASTAGKSLAEPLQGPGNLTIYVTNVSDRGFTVSWTTNTAVTGEVHYGAGKPPSLSGTDVEGPGPTTIHYFTISGLAASTTYYFEVQSGNKLYDNKGAYYSAMTAPVSPMPPPQGAILAWGSALPARSTTPMPNAIVYLQVRRSTGNSQLASTRADAVGQWWYDLQRLRSGDGQFFFLPQPGETLSLTTDGGPLGQGRMTTQVPGDNSISVVKGLFEPQIQSVVYLPVLLSP